MRKDKLGNLYCKRGFEVSSDTGFKKCPKCKYRENNNLACIVSQAGAMAIGKTNEIIKEKGDE